MISVLSGERVRVFATLLDDSSTAAIPTTSTVKMSIRQGDVVVAGPVTCVHTTPGADWTNRKVCGVFNRSVTSLWTKRKGCSIEVDIRSVEEPNEPDKWLSEPFFNIELGTI
jgi:hypothetical protein